jgi:glyceraldehyde-3-phosphate dehydrogenase/erythrose-4-phosphate dehydrogenase
MHEVLTEKGCLMILETNQNEYNLTVNIFSAASCTTSIYSVPTVEDTLGVVRIKYTRILMNLKSVLNNMHKKATVVVELQP